MTKNELIAAIRKELGLYNEYDDYFGHKWADNKKWIKDTQIRMEKIHEIIERAEAS